MRYEPYFSYVKIIPILILIKCDNSLSCECVHYLASNTLCKYVNKQYMVNIRLHKHHPFLSCTIVHITLRAHVPLLLFFYQH